MRKGKHIKKCEMYECEKCGKWFSVVRDAEKCEQYHVKLELILEYEYKNGGVYPERITVKMENGYEREYHK